MPYKNREDKNEQARRWKRNNRDKVNESQRKYRITHPTVETRTPEQMRGKNMTARENSRIFLTEHLGGCCVSCNSKQNLEFDHINPALKTTRQSPLSMGRDKMIQEAENLQILCHDCHQKKSDAQRKAAWNLFISLPLEEQEKLLLEYI